MAPPRAVNRSMHAYLGIGLEIPLSDIFLGIPMNHIKLTNKDWAYTEEKF